MTLHERIEAVFNGQKPDAMAWFADLGYWYQAHGIMEDLPGKWRGPRGIGQAHRELNVGEYVPGCCAYDEIEYDSVAISRKREGNIQVTTWHTPVGSLRSVSEYLPIAYCWGNTEHPVKAAEDLKVVRYIVEHRRYIPRPDNVAQIDRDYGDYGLPIIATRASPMNDLYKEWVGLMDLTYLLADAPDEVYKTLDVMAESQKELFRITAESSCRYVMLCENLTADTMGGLFDLHSRDYLKEKIAMLHEHGKKVIVHIDGRLRGLVEKLPGIGVDCLDAVTPKPVGDVGVDEIRGLTGNEILIMGGLPGAMFAPPFTARDIDTHVKNIIRLHKDSGRWIFGVADQVPPNGDIRLVKRVSDLVEEYGRY